MKGFYVIIWLIMLLAVGISTTLANSAQPGFWYAGGTGTFSLLFPEDSVAYKKVQMVRELVAIQLYPGYAVVKGSYWMHNTSNDSLSLRAGYPLYGEYETEGQHYDKMQISFDSLSAMRVKLNGQMAYEYTDDSWAKIRNKAFERWYVFQTHFAPLDTLLIEVYFILNTNNTSITQDYSNREPNGFIYLLETGATWKQPIVQGEVRLQMMDGLKVDDIIGLAPDSVILIHEPTQTLVYRFENLYPNPESNIVVSYHEQVEDFDFHEVIANQEEMYAAIEAFASQPALSNLESTKFKDPFRSYGVNWGAILFMGALFCMYILFPILGVVLVVYIIHKAINAYYKATKHGN